MLSRGNSDFQWFKERTESLNTSLAPSSSRLSTSFHADDLGSEQDPSPTTSDTSISSSRPPPKAGEPASASMSSSSMSFISPSEADASASHPSFLDPSSNGSEADEIDSLPDSEPDSDDVTISESDFEESDADKEWKESLQQLEMILSMVIVPYLGKYFGRKFAYYGWKQFMEWKYPVEIVVTNKAAFKATGMVEAAASL